MIAFKVSLDALTIACDNVIDNSKRKAEVTKAKDILAMCYKAKSLGVVYTSVGEQDFRWLFM